MNSMPAQVLAVRPVILIVEDEFLIRAMLGETLRDAGYAVIEAASGDEAAIIISETPPDLIITDVRMPGRFDGIALMTKVRETNLTLPIIITSAHLLHVEGEGDVHTHFLPKPYDYDNVIEIIRNELR